MIPRFISLLICLFISLIALVACNSDSEPLPTLRPTLAGSVDATVDPNLGSGFDPNLGGEDNNNNDTQPTPTRESGSAVGGDTESGARGTGFEAQITGGSIADITDGGQYACNLAGHRITSGNMAAPNITVTLPTANAIGTHTLSATDNTIDIQVFLSSVDDSYTQITGGTVTIDELPEVEGDFVGGSFDFTIRNGTGTEIGVRGNFYFESGDTAYC